MVRVLYVCRGVDDDDPFTGVQVAWIRTLAAHPAVDSVHVLARYAVPVDLPDNVTLRTFGRARGRKLRFVREVARTPPPRPDVYLVTQGGPWPLLLLPFKIVRRRRVYQWLAQPVLSRRTRAAMAIVDDGIFTATAGSLPPDLKRVHVLGHGIDVERFRPATDDVATRNILVAGRISPAKGIEEMIVAFARARDRHGLDATLDIVGRSSSANREYVARLEATVARLGVADRVRFLGAVPYDEMPKVVAGYALVLNFSSTALDKAVVEAMAAGVPVLATNRCVAEILPDDLAARLVVGTDDVDAQARAMSELVALDGDARRELTRRLRAIAVEGHSVEHLFDAMVGVIASDSAEELRRHSPR